MVSNIYLETGIYIVSFICGVIVNRLLVKLYDRIEDKNEPIRRYAQPIRRYAPPTPPITSGRRLESDIAYNFTNVHIHINIQEGG